jgi:hypothetical protein
VQRALARRVGQLARHRLEVLSGREQQHATARALVVVACGVRLHEQQRGAHVHRQRRVDRRGIECLEVLVAGHRVVGDEDVDVPERFGCRGHAVGRRGGIGEVALQPAGRPELVRQRRHARRIGAPWLAGVVRREALDEDVSAQLAQPRADRVADPGAPAHAGHERPAACQRLAQSPSSAA